MIFRAIINKYLISKARRHFLRNVNYLGNLDNLEILRAAKARPFQGSVASDIVIEDGFRFFSGALVSQNGGKIYIGRNVQIGFNVMIGAVERVSIGNNVLMSDNITIVDNNNHPVNPIDRRIMREDGWNTPLRFWKYSVSSPITIKDNVWIGANVRICKGVTIGEGSVIAANAVVVKDVPANSICAGNPGKIVKTDIDKLPRLISDN